MVLSCSVPLSQLCFCNAAVRHGIYSFREPRLRPREYNSDRVLRFPFQSEKKLALPHRGKFICSQERQSDVRPHDMPAGPAPSRPKLGSSTSASFAALNERPDSVVLPKADTVNTQAVQSVAILNAVTVLWGSQHAVIKLALTDSSGGTVTVGPSVLNFLRFALAAAVCLPFFPRNRESLRRALMPGMELGLWMFLGYAAQSIGLLSTSASRSGFLLYLNVKLVPVFAAVLYRRRIPLAMWGSAAVAFAGTALLSYDGIPPNIGDVWSILAAAASAMFILRMEAVSSLPETKPAALNAVSLVTVALLTGVWACASVLVHGNDLPSLGLAVASAFHSPDVWFPIAYLGVITTALTNWLQAVGQRTIPAEQAAVIFALDPVYGALFANLLIGEQFGSQGFVGASLIIAAAVASNLTARETKAKL